MKRNAIRISLIELADALHSLDGVSAAACVVFDDEGEVGIAAFVTTDGTCSAAELGRASGGDFPTPCSPTGSCWSTSSR